jgi:hypothetical protein
MTRVSAVLPLSSFAIFPSSSFFRSRVIGPVLRLGSNESHHALLPGYRIFVCVPTSIRCSNTLLGHVPQQSSPPATGFLWLPVGYTPDMDGSGAMLRNPESHTFGLAVIGGIGSLLPRHAGLPARTLESVVGWSSVSVSSSAVQAVTDYITLYAGVRS